MCKVSIIIPIFNAEKYLRECLDSIVSQTLDDIEIICVNDGSNDNSLMILNEYAETDNRFVIITQKNQGPGIARNTGINIAKGEYLFFVDADDILMPMALSNMYSNIIENNSDVCICKSNEFETNVNQGCYIAYAFIENLLPDKKCFTPEEISQNIFQAFVGWPWDKIYKTSFIKGKEIKFPALPNSEDTYFVYRALIEANIISLEKQILINHRINVSSSVSNSRELMPDAFIVSMDMLYEHMNKNNIYAEYQKSFIEYFYTFSYWHLTTISPKTQHYLYKKVKKYIKQRKLDINGKKLIKDEYAFKIMFHYMKNHKFKPLDSKKSSLVQIFSIKNSPNKSHKIITILGFKIKIRRHYE